MDAVTYPHPQVLDELEKRWIERRVDVSEERELATHFDVVTIPTAILLDATGGEIGRVVGFCEPEAFVERLRRARRAR